MTRIAVFDLELTAWEGSLQRRWSEPWEEPEIVQIGAVKLVNDDLLEEVESCDLLVAPRINPVLSDYFVRLTGISSARLAEVGVAFTDALERFERFMADCTHGYFFGGDAGILRHNCRLAGVDFPFDDGRLVDVRPSVAGHLGPTAGCLTSGTLPESLGFVPPGQPHDAVADSRCVAEALRILRRAGSF